MNLMRDEKTFKDVNAGKRSWPRPEDPLAPGGRIGARLRALYAEIEQEPIPTDLIELLEQLDEAEQRQRK